MMTRHPLPPVLLLLALTLLGACTTAPMKVREQHYYAITNGTTTNYYRLRVSAETRLGQSEYRSGYFPADAVDALFGEIKSENAGEAIAARLKIEEMIRQAIEQTTRAWLVEARKVDADPAKLENLLNARRRVLAYPESAGKPFKGAVEIEYNPALGVFIRHADEKLIFILSSDPDDIVGAIAQQAESNNTVYSINQLGKVIAQRTRNEIVEAEAAEAADAETAATVGKHIGNVLETLTPDSEPNPDQMLLQIDTLLAMLELVR